MSGLFLSMQCTVHTCEQNTDCRRILLAVLISLNSNFRWTRPLPRLLRSAPPSLWSPPPPSLPLPPTVGVLARARVWLPQSAHLSQQLLPAADPRAGLGLALPHPDLVPVQPQQRRDLARPGPRPLQPPTASASK